MAADASPTPRTTEQWRAAFVHLDEQAAALATLPKKQKRGAMAALRKATNDVMQSVSGGTVDSSMPASAAEEELFWCANEALGRLPDLQPFLKVGHSLSLAVRVKAC